jgi:hypothetical protein
MIKLNINSDPPTEEQVLSTKKKLRLFGKIIMWFFKLGLPAVIILFVSIFLITEDLESNWTAMKIGSMFFAFGIATLWITITNIRKDQSLLSILDNPEEIVGLCRKHDVCEQYRLKVVALGRPILKVEARLFEQYDKAMKEESMKQKNESAMEKPCSQKPLDLEG